MESLVVMPSLQIVVSSFSGAHTLLLVRKKRGKEHSNRRRDSNLDAIGAKSWDASDKKKMEGELITPKRREKNKVKKLMEYGQGLNQA